MTFLGTLNPEVTTMITQTFEDVFSPAWVSTHIIDPTHDLVILRKIIPWQPITRQPL